MMKRLRQLTILLVFDMPWKAMATEYSVQPGDNLSTAISKLQAGDKLYLADGQYDLTSQLSIKCSGNASAMITIAAAEGAKPIIDFRGEANKKNGIVVSGNYLHIKNLTIRYAGYKGIWLEGAKYCILEGLDVYGCCNAGIQLRSGGYNTVVNCDSHDNFDYQDAGGNADGFADKQGEACPGNVYIGCRAWGNSDDGWDSYQRVTSGTPTVYINCITYNNGPAKYDLSQHPRVLGVDKNLSCFTGKDLANFSNGGNPNGFKLGGKGTVHHTELYRCLAIGHRSKGFDQNSNAGNMLIVNCTSYKNDRNYYFYNNNGYHLDIYNCISLQPVTNDGFQNDVTTQSNNTWNDGFSVSVDNFESLDVENLLLAPRNADGTLPDNLLLKLKITATNLIDKGAVIDKSIFKGDSIANYISYNGAAPDLGCYETSGTDTKIFGIVSDAKELNPHLPCYNLQGRRVDTNYRGIIIQNGHKVATR